MKFLNSNLEIQNEKKVWRLFKKKKKLKCLKSLSQSKLFNVYRCNAYSYNNTYMIALTLLTNTEIFAFMTVLVLKLLSDKVLFISTKDNRK